MSVKVEPNEKCHICNLELDTFDLFIHFEKEQNGTTRENTEDKKVMCELCDKFMKDKISLQNHIAKVHKKEKNVVKQHISKPASCNICGKTYSSSSNMQIHVKNCHDKAPHSVIEKKKENSSRKCEICEKIISSNHPLEVQNHMDSHTGQKTKCKFCGLNVLKIQKHISRIHFPKK